jgi:hypothetical protein
MIILQYTLCHSHFLWSVWTTDGLLTSASISLQ